MEREIRFICVFIVSLFLLFQFFTPTVKVITLDVSEIRAEMQKEFDQKYDNLIKENEELSANRIPYEFIAFMIFLGLVIFGLFIGYFYNLINDRKLKLEELKLEEKKRR